MRGPLTPSRSALNLAVPFEVSPDHRTIELVMHPPHQDHGPLPDRIHYGCGLNVWPGWLNVDRMDASFPAGEVSSADIDQIMRVDLVEAHPFPDAHFHFGYAEDFLEHLSQAESLVFLSECRRTFALGGVLRLSFPGLQGVLDRHFGGFTHEEALRGVHEAYTMWRHQHFYCLGSLEIVALHLGFRSVQACSYGASSHDVLRGLETRPDQADLNLVVELTR